MDKYSNVYIKEIEIKIGSNILYINFIWCYVNKVDE